MFLINAVFKFQRILNLPQNDYEYNDFNIDYINKFEWFLKEHVTGGSSNDAAINKLLFKICSNRKQLFIL